MSEKLVNEQAVIDVIDGFNVFESRGDQIALELKIRELPPAEITLEQVKAYCEPRCLTVVTDELVKYWQNNVSVEPLTDMEQRIFLAAMRKEEEVCRKVDKEIDGDVNLTKVCKEIERKVKGALWT